MAGSTIGRRSAVSLAAVGAALLLQAGSAAADQLARGEVFCYARAFSAEYLADPRNQALSLVELTLVVDTGLNEQYADAVVTVRAMPRGAFGTYLVDDGSCAWDYSAQRYGCAMECGGRIDVSVDDDGSVSLINVRDFALGSECERPVPADDAHAAFQLFPIPLEACPVDLRRMYGDG